MCLFVVFLEKSFLTKLNFITHQTVTLVAPDTHAFYLNEVFNFDIKVDNITQAINAAQFELNYNPKLLEALDVDFSQSFANIFLEKEVDNNSGYIRVSGGLPNPGITDKQAIFATIYFKAISPGTSPIKILPRSQVLANDGHGTNILKSTDEYQILILPEIASNQEPTTIEALKQSKPVLGITTNHQDIQDYTKATMDIFRNLPHPDTEKINQTLNQDTFIQRLFRKIITLDDFILNIFRIKH